MLPGTLAHIRRNESAHEIVVVDAMSTDETVKIAESAKCMVLPGADRNRAKQMNLGANHARGEILFFLHADTLITTNVLQRMAAALADPPVVGGGFRRRYLNAPTFLRFTCVLADVRSRWLGWYLGDQGIFVRRTVFDQLGGFRDLPLFEDLDFCHRLKRTGKLVCLGPPVWSSARRFSRRGAFVTSLFDLWLTLRYLSGADPARLAEFSRTGITRRNVQPPEASHP